MNKWKTRCQKKLLLNNDNTIAAVHVSDEQQISNKVIELYEPDSNILFSVHEQPDLSNQLDDISDEAEQHLIQHITPRNEKLKTTSGNDLSLQNIIAGISTRSTLTKTQRNNLLQFIKWSNTLFLSF